MLHASKHVVTRFFIVVVWLGTACVAGKIGKIGITCVFRTEEASLLLSFCSNIVFLTYCGVGSGDAWIATHTSAEGNLLMRC